MVSLTTYRNPAGEITTDPVDMQGDVTTWGYDPATGLELRKTYADNSSVVKTYDAYNRLEADSLPAEGKTHLITETRDALGRSTGFTYAKDGTTQHTVTTGYGAFFNAV